jgi:hypothetical protein
MVDLLLRLFDKGIELLREGDKQKGLFFEDVVKPTHSLFERMYQEHIATLERTREMLLDPTQTPTAIARFVNGRVLFEQGTIERLLPLTRLGEPHDWRRIPGG